jgi:erythromycin esterase
MSSLEVEQLTARVADATIVGLGTSTRAGAQTFGFVEEVTRCLLDQGFRTIAVRDNQRVGELYDAFVTGRLDSLDSVLPQAWGPWRTNEMHRALVWLREYNQGRIDPVRMAGVGSSRVLVADYDRVLELVAPEDEQRVRKLFDVIRVAHENGEHVQRARGTHPGTPFVELAREAATLVHNSEGSQLMDAIVQHHANAIGVGYDARRDDEETAGRLLARGKVIFWEGSAHVAAQFPLGARLRAEMGDAYRAVHVTFGSGVVAGVSVPPPAAGSLEYDLLSASEHKPLLVTQDLSEGPARIRLISGLYDPAQDEKHYYELPSLRGSFDAVMFFPEVTSTTWFGTAKP